MPIIHRSPHLPWTGRNGGFAYARYKQILSFRRQPPKNVVTCHPSHQKTMPVEKPSDPPTSGKSDPRSVQTRTRRKGGAKQHILPSILHHTYVSHQHMQSKQSRTQSRHRLDASDYRASQFAGKNLCTGRMPVFSSSQVKPKLSYVQALPSLSCALCQVHR